MLARFITDERGLHMQRFDRGGSCWVQDSSVAGFLTGRNDFAERASII